MQRQPALAASSTSAPQSEAGREDVVTVAKAAGDPRRAGLLQVLQHDSFSVGELSFVMRLAQPALSHHLKVLRESGLVSQRREGNSIYYRRADVAARPLSQALFTALDESPLASDLSRQVERVYAERQATVDAFFANNKDALESQGKLICEASVYASTLQDLWQGHAGPRETAMEVGPGSGDLLTLLAQDYADVTAVDANATMLKPVQELLSDVRNIHFREADFFKLPRDQKFDLIVAAMVVHHLPSPRRFFQVAGELLGESGQLCVVELHRHEHNWVQEACGDVWLGFQESELDGWAQSAGLNLESRQHLAQRNGFSIQLARFAPVDQQDTTLN